MSLESLDLDHAEAIALLQPFVDGELGDDERELVARQIAENPEYQAFVREQQKVRAALQTLALEVAPEQLRERVLAELDAIEAERSSSVLAPIVGRIKSFGRGALLMVPAAAAAGVLFVVASNAGWLEAGKQIDGVHVDGGMAKSLRRPEQPAPAPSPSPMQAAAPAPADVAMAMAEGERGEAERADASLPSAQDLAGNLDFAVQVAPPRSLPSDVALVSDAARSSATVRYRVGDGTVVVDEQRRAGAELPGPRQVFRGHAYQLGRDQQGRPLVAFQVGGVHHQLVHQGARLRPGAGVGVDEPDFRVLLVVADALRQAHG